MQAYSWMKRIVLFSLGLTVFYAGIQFDLLELQQTLHAEKKAELHLKKQIQEAFAAEFLLENEIAEFPKLKNLLNEWQKKLIKPANIQDLLREIASMGKENQLRFKLFNKENQAIQHDYLKLPVTLKLTGAYDNILNFFIQITNMPWLIAIENFMLGNLGEKYISAEISLEVYYSDF